MTYLQKLNLKIGIATLLLVPLLIFQIYMGNIEMAVMALLVGIIAGFSLFVIKH